MSGLKSAWELSLEKTDKMVPGAGKKLTEEKKQEIADLRKEYQAKIADKDVTMQHKIKVMAEQIPPEHLENETLPLREEFAQEKLALEKEMEEKIQAVHDRK